MVQAPFKFDDPHAAKELVRALYPRIDALNIDQQYKVLSSASEGVALSDIVCLEHVPTDGDCECIFAARIIPRAILGQLRAISGIITTYEDPSSHLSVVCRSKGIPVVNIGDSEFLKLSSYLKEGVNQGACALDSFSEAVLFGAVELKDIDVAAARRSALSFLRDSYSIDINANADSAEDIRAAVSQGFCHSWPRSETLLYDINTLNYFNALLLDPSNAHAGRMFISSHTNSISALFREAKGTTIGFRLLDPPSHEFLPNLDEHAQIDQLADALGKSPADTKVLLRRHYETNPMIGHRGARLLLTNCRLLEAQVISLLGAWNVTAPGLRPPTVDILIPFVMATGELRAIKAAIAQIVSERPEYGEIPIRLGCMVELPSLLPYPEEVAQEVEFVSFGTNDLIALTYGISRGDSYQRYLLEYLRRDILENDPFLILPEPIIHQICEFSRQLRATNRNIKIDICGEQVLSTDLAPLIRARALDSVSIGAANLPVFLASLLRNKVIESA